MASCVIGESRPAVKSRIFYAGDVMVGDYNLQQALEREYGYAPICRWWDTDLDIDFETKLFSLLNKPNECGAVVLHADPNWPIASAEDFMLIGAALARDIPVCVFGLGEMPASLPSRASVHELARWLDDSALYNRRCASNISFK